MKNDNFWMISLVSFFVLFVNLGRPFPLRVAVIANSCLVLWGIARKLWEVYHA